MPYQTVSEYREPDVFLEYNGVTVYHDYNEDEYDEPCDWWFAVNVDHEKQSVEGDGVDFDVRDLPHPKTALLAQPRLAQEIKKSRAEGKSWPIIQVEIIRDILKDMIDVGVITNEGVKGTKP